MLGRRAVLAGLGAAVAAGRAGAATRPRGPGRDLEGVWTTASYTELERPPELRRLVVTPAEAEAYEKPRRGLGGGLPTPATTVGIAENEYFERGGGLARVKGEIRSSWIVDPPDGRIPWSPWALSKHFDRWPPVTVLDADNPEQRIGPERCLANGNGGAPMIGLPDSSLFQIIQPPGGLVILTEKYHDARIVRFEPPVRPAPRSWLGESTGRWEGDTLVVETARFPEGVINRGFLMFMTGDTRVTERFTRLGAGELFYEFTIADPVLFTKAWRAEMSCPAVKGSLFEYACHEGNYGLPGILAGARREEREARAGR
jgi:hypothetical protein